MNQEAAVHAAQALMQQSLIQSITDYVATSDPDWIDQSESGRRKVARNLLWEALQSTSYTDRERRDIMESLLCLVLGQPVIVATVSGKRAPGELILLIENCDYWGRAYGRVVVAHQSYYIPDQEELDSSIKPGWWATCREATEQERVSDAFQQLQRQSDEIRAADVTWQKEREARYERERTAAYEEIAAEGRMPTDQERLFIDLTSGTSDN